MAAADLDEFLTELLSQLPADELFNQTATPNRTTDQQSSSSTTQSLAAPPPSPSQSRPAVAAKSVVKRKRKRRTRLATTPTVRQPASAPSTAIEATSALASTQRLNKEMANAALQVVLEQLLVSNLVNVNHARITAFADDETLGAARTLYTCVVERMLCEHVMCEVERRGLLPVTINTLSSLLCEALALYKLK